MMRNIMVVLAAIVLPVAAAAFTVVIDPGHGGKDVGCEGENTYEKDVNLNVALRFGSLIKGRHGDKVQVIYTRDDDTFVSLNDRALKANEAGADLYVSIHVNSVEKTTAGREKLHGTSVYVFSPDKYGGNFGVLTRRRVLTKLDRKGRPRVVNYDAASDESAVAYELLQTSNVARSADLGLMILKAMADKAGREDKGLRQGPFQVLWSSAMPSVLVELEYMCNPEQEAYLTSETGVKQLSEALADAFDIYYKKYKDF